MTNDNVAVTSNVRDAVILTLGDAGGKEKGGRRKRYVCVSGRVDDVRATRGKGDVVVGAGLLECMMRGKKI